MLEITDILLVSEKEFDEIYKITNRSAIKISSALLIFPNVTNDKSKIIILFAEIGGKHGTAGIKT